MVNRKHSKKNKTCKVYKSCRQVPCGETMNRCSPSYCSTGSKNWGLCNMSNWGGKYRSLRSHCRSEKKCKMVENRVSEDQVPMAILEAKLPFIWRHLGNKTRRKMVRLSRLPIEKLNISEMK